MLLYKKAHAVQLRTLRDIAKAKRLFDTIDDIVKVGDKFYIRMKWPWQFSVNKGDWLVTDGAVPGRVKSYSPVAFEVSFEPVAAKKKKIAV